MNKTIQAHLALITVSLIYSFTFSIVKEVTPIFLSPSAFIVIRVSVCLVLFWLISHFIIRQKVDNKDIPRLMVLAAFGVAINQSMFLRGMTLTTPINAAIIMMSNPVFVLIIASVALKEKISFQKIAGICFCICGALLLLLFKKNFSFGSETILGDLMILINSLSWAGYVVLVKPLMQKYNTFTIVKWVFFFGLIYVLPIGFNDLINAHWSTFTPVVWGNIAFTILGGTFIAYILNTYALRALSPSAMSVYNYLPPFFTTLIAIYFYCNDNLDTRKIVSGVLIIIGVYLVSRATISSNKK